MGVPVVSGISGRTNTECNVSFGDDIQLAGLLMTVEKVQSWADQDSVEKTLVVGAMGMRGESFVIQFAFQTESTLYVMCYAAPDDNHHEKWFILFILADYDANDPDTLVEATEAADEYLSGYDRSAYLDGYLGVEMDLDQEVEAQIESFSW